MHAVNQNCWQTPLENAVTFGHGACCRLLIAAGADVNRLNRNFRSTPLTEACSKGYDEIALLLLDSGADPSLSMGVTPLIRAVGFPTIVQFLLQRGVRVDGQNAPNYQANPGGQALHEAAAYGEDESVALLLQAGADRDAKDIEGRTPLDRAKWHLNNHRTSPCNPPDVTAEIIARSEKIIQMLSQQESLEI